jgi:hypothetical protein
MAMTTRQLKDKVQAALTAVKDGRIAETLDEIIAELSGRGPSGAYHAEELLRCKADPGRLAAELTIVLDRLENHPELLE